MKYSLYSTGLFNQSLDLFSAPIDEEELPFPQLLANVGNEATPVDILASRTNIPVHEVMMQLLELELSGHVVAVSGGYIRKGRG
jgi:DNA processing protein